jgi:hypothetical protein
MTKRCNENEKVNNPKTDHMTNIFIGKESIKIKTQLQRV